MLPILISVISLIHLILLHQKGSSNPTQRATNIDKIKFHPMFSVKDRITILVTILILVTTLANFPNILGDVENFNIANPMVAPLHIQPEWYFLFAYVILRSIPSKLGGVIALLISLLVLMVLVTKKEKSSKFNKTKKTKI
jgi:ubiquinol-cytochrome c reductase cytochrome b subunit